VIRRAAFGYPPAPTMPLDVTAYPILPHRPARPRIAGISGGASSGMMAALMSPGAVLAFQNTAREAPRTYEFLDRWRARFEKSPTGSPARADNMDRMIRLLDRISDSLHELAHREPIKVVCECRGGG